MAGAKSEISNWRRYDYVIVNKDIDDAYEELETILKTERLKRLRRLDLEPLVQSLLAAD